MNDTPLKLNGTLRVAPSFKSRGKPGPSHFEPQLSLVMPHQGLTKRGSVPGGGGILR